MRLLQYWQRILKRIGSSEQRNVVCYAFMKSRRAQQKRASTLCLEQRKRWSKVRLGWSGWVGVIKDFEFSTHPALPSALSVFGRVEKFHCGDNAARSYSMRTSRAWMLACRRRSVSRVGAACYVHVRNSIKKLQRDRIKNILDLQHTVACAYGTKINWLFCFWPRLCSQFTLSRSKGYEIDSRLPCFFRFV